MACTFNLLRKTYDRYNEAIELNSGRQSTGTVLTATATDSDHATI